MVENTAIEWAHHTFNPWKGCQKVSPACDYCYAERWSRRSGQPHLWNGERERTSESYWFQPRKWNRRAEAAGFRERVFCASLADVFDNQVPEVWRIDLWALIYATPHLDWLLLTKRPQNIRGMLPLDWGDGWRNVWLGTTVENQTEAERRIPKLRDIPAVVRFLSCEPLLSGLSLDFAWHGVCATCWGTGTVTREYFSDDGTEPCRECKGSGNSNPYGDQDGIHWVIAGGESGPNARASNPQWFRDIRDQCIAADVLFMFKQWGEWVSVSEVEGPGRHYTFPDGRIVRRVGKKRAGRTLDGREWNESPDVPTNV